MGLSAGACDARKSVATEVLDALDRLKATASELSVRSENALHSVMRDPGPECVGKNVPEPCRAYPPLFDELRSKIESINHSLRCISEHLDRIEL